MSYFKFTIQDWSKITRMSKQAIYKKVSNGDYKVSRNELGQQVLEIDIPDDIIHNMQLVTTGSHQASPDIIKSVEMLGSLLSEYKKDMISFKEELKDNTEKLDKKNDEIVKLKDDQLRQKEEQIKELKKLLSEKKGLLKRIFG